MENIKYESCLQIKVSKDKVVSINYDSKNKLLCITNKGKTTVLESIDKLLKEINIFSETKLERYIPLCITTSGGHKFYTVYGKDGLIEEYLDKNHMTYNCYKFFVEFSELLSRRYFQNV